MKKCVINGKFLSQQITGVQRYARETVSALDEIATGLNIEIAVPKDAQNLPNLKNIKIKHIGGRASIFWEQISLPFYIIKNRAVGLHLCHVAPILKPDYVCIHDANVEKNPQWFTKKLVLWYKIIHWACALFAKKIFTVSNFSKNELQEIFKIQDSQILNIGSGWQHINNIPFDNSVLNRFNLKEHEFFFSLGTLASHKNIKWIISYAQKHPKEKFVLSGRVCNKIFKQEHDLITNNVQSLGYLTDSEVKTLMSKCKAFVFPSFYEGFGLPPLEAFSLGTDIIVSDIPVMRELFASQAHYINPFSIDMNLEDLLQNKICKKNEILDKYGWNLVAKRIINTLK